MASDGEEALLVQDGDPYALAGAMARLLEDEGLCRRLSAAARTRALARHDPVAIRDALLEIYGKVAGDRPSAGGMSEGDASGSA